MKAIHEVRNYHSDFCIWNAAYENIGFLAHWHKEVEFIYVKQGFAKISINDYTLLAQEGDLILCDSGNIHYCDANEAENALEFLVFDLKLVEPYAQSAQIEQPLFTKKRLEDTGLTQHWTLLYETITQELSSRDAYYQEIVTSRLRDFWFRLKRCFPVASESPLLSAQTPRLTTLNDLQVLLSYLEKHYSEQITLTYAAKMMNFSDSHFSKMFKKLTGINFVTYLNRIRIEEAAHLLKKDPSKITSIAFSCGFANVRSFNRVFKEFTGHTPSEYMRLPGNPHYNFNYQTMKSAQTQLVELGSQTVIPKA